MIPDYDILIQTTITVLAVAGLTLVILYGLSRLADALRVGLQALTHEITCYSRLFLDRMPAKPISLAPPQYACLVIHGTEDRSGRPVLLSATARFEPEAIIRIQTMRETTIRRVYFAAPLDAFCVQISVGQDVIGDNVFGVMPVTAVGPVLKNIVRAIPIGTVLTIRLTKVLPCSR